MGIAVLATFLWCGYALTTPAPDPRTEAERAPQEALELAIQTDTLAARYANRCSDRRVKLEKVLGSWYVTAGSGSAGAPADVMLGPNWRVVTRPLDRQGYREIALADVDPACDDPSEAV